jgi:hypothetical protein
VSSLKQAGFFSPDYATARERFRQAAGAANATLHSLPLPARGPAGEALAIDVAWLGSREPQRVFLHICGLHGIEAYTGSAVQLALLGSAPAPSADQALVLVHVLNPYGMAWLRRTNENNVDLNRNFLVNGESWSGAPALYRELDPLLNPRSPPSRDAFALRAAAAALRHGYHAVKDAIAEGQYEYPQALFFGGTSLQPGPSLLIDWLRTQLRTAQYVFALDLHTGLGRSGTDTAIPEMRVNVTPIGTLETALGRELTDVSRPSVAYEVRGSMGAALPRVLAHAQMDCVLQEIGTYGPLTVLHALREENRWHFFGDGSIVHPAKQRLREALCPAAIEWRRRAVELGVALARAAARWTFEGTLRQDGRSGSAKPVLPVEGSDRSSQ